MEVSMLAHILHSDFNIRQLRDNGFTVFSRIIDLSLIERLVKTSDHIIDHTPKEHLYQFRYHGTMIPVPYWCEVFRELITHPAAVTAMRVLQFMDPKWISGYIISKPAGGLPLWWHQDWWAWDEPVSASEAAPYVFFMYYLVDTDRRNGCLRVISGSHRQRIDLHDNLPAIHTSELNTSPLQLACSCAPSQRGSGSGTCW